MKTQFQVLQTHITTSNKNKLSYNHNINIKTIWFNLYNLVDGHILTVIIYHFMDCKQEAIYFACFKINGVHDNKKTHN
jgi:hypothetical protein